MINKEHYAKEVKGFCEIAKKLPKIANPNLQFSHRTHSKNMLKPQNEYFS